MQQLGWSQPVLILFLLSALFYLKRKEIGSILQYVLQWIETLGDDVWYLTILKLMGIAFFFVVGVFFVWMVFEVIIFEFLGVP